MGRTQSNPHPDRLSGERLDSAALRRGTPSCHPFFRLSLDQPAPDPIRPRRRHRGLGVSGQQVEERVARRPFVHEKPRPPSISLETVPDRLRPPQHVPVQARPFGRTAGDRSAGAIWVARDRAPRPTRVAGRCRCVPGWPGSIVPPSNTCLARLSTSRSARSSAACSSGVRRPSRYAPSSLQLRSPSPRSGPRLP